MLMRQQRPDPRRRGFALVDGTVARLALNLGELLGDEKDLTSDHDPGRDPACSAAPAHYTNTAACVMPRPLARRARDVRPKPSWLSPPLGRWEPRTSI